MEWVIMGAGILFVLFWLMCSVEIKDGKIRHIPRPPHWDD